MLPARFFSVELGAKRLDLPRDLAPNIASIGLLLNPNNPNAAVQTKEMQAAATALRVRLNVVNATSQSNFGDAFATLARERVNGLVVSVDPFFMSHCDQPVALALRHSIPAVYYAREFAAAGGLISYASGFADSFRQAGTYVGRILKGEKPAELPVTRVWNCAGFRLPASHSSRRTQAAGGRKAPKHEIAAAGGTTAVPRAMGI